MNEFNAIRRTYRVFDMTLSSNCPMPELPKAERTDADIDLQLLPAADPAQECEWFHSWFSEQDPSEVHCMVARELQGYRVRYPRIADFLINDGLDRVCAAPYRAVPRDSIRHLFLDSLLPRILGQRGRLIVHASAVVSPGGRGMAFVGGSGWGKSTLASAFYQRGYRLIADDSLELSLEGEHLLGVPAYGGSRLLADSVSQLFPGGVRSVRMAHYSGKHRVELPVDGSASAATLGALYLLDDPTLRPARDREQRVTIEEVRGIRATMGLIRRSYLLDVEDMAAVRRQFESANRVAAAGCGIYLLGYPRDFARLPELIRAVEEARS